MGFFYFLGKRKFYIQVLIAILLTIFLIWGVLQSLAWYTRHGDVYLVPDFSGKTVNELKQQHYDQYFTLNIIDSVYDKNHAPGSIVMQNPLPGSQVKQGRNIYFTVVSKRPEMVDMPNLKNLSLRQALVTLDEKGLPVANLNYVDYFARNAIIDQYVNGEPIEPGTQIPKGTYITLIVGRGNNPGQVPIPFIIGKKVRDAHEALHYASLNVGKEYFIDGDDTTHARVFKTEPGVLSNSLMNEGDSITIWYRSDENFDFKNYIKQLTNATTVDSTAIDSTTMDTIKVKRTPVKYDTLQ
ncbi:MAG: PASTA domain-containing protein [Bacteroidales bacterium]|nr:PASTA domain-containing protein [Bacteroidales bacterium]